MTDTTPRAGAPLLAAAQAQKHVTHNEALLQFDALLCARILDRDLTDPPAFPAGGDTYLVKATGTGAWAGQDGNIAYAVDGGWRFYAPFEGLSAYIADEAVMLVYASGAWTDWASVLDLQNIPLLGVNTTADATNKLAAKSSALLFDNVGNGVQVKINKNAAADTASFLYQTNYSGRAEIGLTGDDDFHFKVSSDGAAWNEAIIVDAATGAIGIQTAPGPDALTVNGGLGFLAGAINVRGGDAFSTLTVDFPELATNQGAVRLFRNTNTAGGLSLQIFRGDGSSSAQTKLSGGSGDSYINALGGNIGLGTLGPTCRADIGDDHLRLRTSKTPATASDAGNEGDICWDANYIYVCVATNSWKRAALASW